MKATIIARLCRLGLIGSIGITFNAIATPACQRAIANQIDRTQPTDTVFREQKTSIKEIDWNILCQKFPFNSRCQEGRPEIIKISLEDFGAKDEWIRIEKTGNKVKLLYTRQTSGGLVGKAIDGVIDAAVPFPFPSSLETKAWTDRQTTRVSFRSDNCQASLSSCTISGTEFLNLPQEMNIRAGIFALEYIEGKLIRSIAFRIPFEAKSETGSIAL